jgi:UMF1 family MFS transporter
MRKKIWGWYFYDWACQPYNTLMLTFIFGPFFAATAVEYYASLGLSEDAADARAQTLWSNALTIVGLIIGFSAPVLGAIADSAGRRRPWLMGFTAMLIAGGFATWFSDPNGGNLIFMLMAFCFGFMGAELAYIFANAQLPEIAQGDDVGSISGSGFAFGYLGGVISLLIVLPLFVAQGDGKTILGIDPLFGFDPSMKEGTRFTGPFVALWCLIFAIPYFAWMNEADRPKSRPSFSVAMTRLKSSVVGLKNRHSQAFFLAASMFYRDAMNGLYTFGGIYATLVLDWDIVKIGVFGIVAAIGAMVFSYLGGKMDRRIGPKPVLLVTIVLLIAVCIVIVSMTKDTIFGVALRAGSTLPDTIFFICGVLIGGFGGMLQSTSRSLMVRHTAKGRETLEFGLYGLSGRATAFLAPALIGIATTITGSARLGVSPLIGLFIIGFILLLWVQPKGDADTWENG